MKCNHCGAEWKTGNSTSKLDSCPFCGERIEFDNFLEKRAEEGHVHAQLELASKYDTPYKTGDYSKAAYWYNKAALQGDNVAQYKLGALYNNKNWSGRDLSKSKYWYTQAANNGNKDAQFELALLYDQNDASDNDYSQAEYWYYQAANNGHVAAQYHLGVLYGFQNWSGQDYTRAEYWLLRNVQAGRNLNRYFPASLYFLGCLYRKWQDYTEAIKWFLRATEEGGAFSKESKKELQNMAIEGHVGAVIALDQIKNRGFSLSRAWNDLFC